MPLVLERVRLGELQLQGQDTNGRHKNSEARIQKSEENHGIRSSGFCRLDHRLRCYFLGSVSLDHVSRLHVAEVPNCDTALESVLYFAGVVFETLERLDF